MPQINQASISFKDKANKAASVSLHFAEAAVIAFATDPTASGAVKDVFDSIADLSLLTEVKREASAALTTIAPAIPTDDQAYRSSKLIVYFYDDVTGKNYSFTIPGRDPVEYNTAPGTKTVLLTVAGGGTAEIESLVSNLNLYAQSQDGNPITVTRVEVAGGRQ